MKRLATFGVWVLLLIAGLCLGLFHFGTRRGATDPSPRPQRGQTPPASRLRSRSTLANPTVGGASASLARNPAAPPAASPKRAWDPQFLASLRQAAEGDSIQFELTDGDMASGLIKYLERTNHQVRYVSGLLVRPQGGRFFFQRQTLPGVAGNFVGVVECPASRRAWRVEPTGPGGASELVERRLEEVMCLKLPRPEAEADPEEIPPLKPDDSPVYPVPTYQEGIAVLESLPGAPAVIYLDFQGGYTPTWNGVTYDRPAMSNAQIRDVWTRVAEDFMPFTINVTTDLKVYQGAAENSRQRVVITPTATAASEAGGVSYQGSFNWTGDVPCWVFITDDTKKCADACSHEAGHALDLNHMGRDANGVHADYFGGQGEGETGWAPIMGLPYYYPITQWSRGEYLFADNSQDQLAIIAGRNNNVRYRPDDTGDTLATARYLEIYSDSNAGAEGVIETTGDVDAFQFTTAGGAVSLRADPVMTSPNLAVEVALYDAHDQLLLSSDPATTLGAALATNLPGGTFTFRVSGAGRNDPRTNGFSAYGSLGYYSITGTVAQARLPDRFTIGEHAPNGTKVGVVAANHPHSHPLRYSITSGNANGAFAIDNSGTLWVADNALLDYETLARQTQLPVQFELFVDLVDPLDPAGTETHRRVVIAITHVNRPPTIDDFSSPNGNSDEFVSGPPARFTTSIVEHTPPGTLVCRVIGSDPDPHTVLSHALVAGNDGGMFRIDPGSGEIQVAGDPTAAVRSVYHLSVAVSDQTPPTPLTVTGMVTIRVELPYPRGHITYAVYTNISGTLVSDLTRAASFPSDPGFTGETALFEWGDPVASNGGAVMRAYLLPPASGRYTFWIASQDNGELWLSASTNPAAMNLIAYIHGEGDGTKPREWTKYPTQRSAPVSLPAGYGYYVEARMKARSGSNHLAVAWECADAGIAQQVIPGDCLTPYFIRFAPHPVGFTAYLHRDAFAGAGLGTVAVTDFDSTATSTLAVVSGNDGGVFALDPVTGAVRLASEEALSASGQTHFSLEVRATDNRSPPLSGTARVAIEVVPANQITTSGLRQEIWTDIGPGTAVADLLNLAKCPKRPDALREITGFDSGRQSFGSNYGSRIRANLTPTNTGAYTFFVASDASSQLKFSATTNPADAAVVAAVPDQGATGYQEWNRYVSQQSSPLWLLAGQSYYLETWHKAAGGHDHVAVGWTGPGLTGTNPIPGSCLSPVDLGFAPVLGSITTKLSNIATNGTHVANLIGIDSAMDTLTYKIVSGNLSNTFHLDPGSRLITLADRSLLASETVTNFQLGVVAQDSGYGGLYPLRSTQATVAIEVEDKRPPIVWCGNGTDANWSTASNWVSGVPGDGRMLEFSGFRNRTNRNDLLTSVRSVAVYETGFRFEGNPLVLRGGLDNSGDNTWAIDSVFNDPQTITHRHGTLVMAGSVKNYGQMLTLSVSDWLRFDGVISGPGGITMPWHGSVVMAASHTYTGPTLIKNGWLVLTNAGAISRSSGIYLNGLPTPLANGTTINLDSVSFGVGSDPLASVGLEVSGMSTRFTVPTGQLLTGQGSVVGESLIQGTLAPQLCRLCATAIVTNKTLFLTYSSSMAFRNNLVLAGDTVMTLGSNSLSSLAVPSYWSDFVGKFTNHVMVYGGRVIETGALGPLPWMGGISVAGELVCGGVLTVTTNVGFIPAYGDTFQLFDARRLSGAFASLRLPALRDGLAWDTRRLMVDGTLQVTLAPPRIAAVTSPGGSLSIRFPTDGGVRYVLESTPSLQPPAPWTPQTTNLGTGEAMTFALPETRAAPQLYFRVGALP